MYSISQRTSHLSQRNEENIVDSHSHVCAKNCQHHAKCSFNFIFHQQKFLHCTFNDETIQFLICMESHCKTGVCDTIWHLITTLHSELLVHSHHDYQHLHSMSRHQISIQHATTCQNLMFMHQNPTTKSTIIVVTNDQMVEILGSFTKML